MIAVANEPEAISHWKTRFDKKHRKEVLRFHSKFSSGTTAIYSSEHFQSLVREKADIERVYELLSNFYEKITLVVYLKRQDRMAFSAHSTAVQLSLIHI